LRIQLTIEKDFPFAARLSILFPRRNADRDVHKYRGGRWRADEWTLKGDQRAIARAENAGLENRGSNEG